jgi:hypothetical protein
MELDAGDIDDEAEQDGEASEVGLAATLSTSAVLNVALGADGVVMPTPTNVDTTRLTGALVASAAQRSADLLPLRRCEARRRES